MNRIIHYASALNNGSFINKFVFTFRQGPILILDEYVSRAGMIGVPWVP